MRTSLLRFAYLVSLVLVSSCGGSDSTTDSTGTGFIADCQKVCAVTAPLMCPKAPPAATCMSSCQQALDAVPAKCKPQVEAAEKCEAMHPTADWECDSIDGEPTIKKGCDNEALAVIACIFSSP
jgi:hypothetical protein